MRCPKCDTRNGPNNERCWKCGNDLVPEPARSSEGSVTCSDWVAELEADLAKYIARKAEAANGTEMHGYWWGARDTAELILARAKKRGRSATGEHSNTPTPRA